MQILPPRYFGVLAFWSAITAAILASTSALAFAPKDWIPLDDCDPVIEFSTRITIPGCNDLVPAYLSGHSHESITREAIRAFALNPKKGNYGVIDPITGSIKITSSIERAITEIVDANADVDLNQFIASAHFDGENFAGGQTRLTNLRKNLITALQANNPHQARINLGEALHTIQDFYSHTNYVELGNTQPHDKLGRPDQPLPSISALDITCDHEFSTLFTSGAGHLIGAGLTQLTSGYYGGEDRKPLLPSTLLQTKCNHGGMTDSLGMDGLNKDTKDVAGSGFAPFSPTHFMYHEKAAELAREATIKFLDELKSDPAISSSRMASLLGADFLVLRNNNNTSTVDVRLTLDLVPIIIPVDIILSPQTQKQFVVPEISRSGSTLVLQGVSSTPSTTGLIGYTLTLPTGYEFGQVISDRGTTTSLSGQTTHSDLLVLSPVSGPAHRSNTYSIRQKP